VVGAAEARANPLSRLLLFHVKIIKFQTTEQTISWSCKSRRSLTLVTKYQISAINSYWEKYLGRTEVKQYTTFGERGYNKIGWVGRVTANIIFFWALSWLWSISQFPCVLHQKCFQIYTVDLVPRVGFGCVSTCLPGQVRIKKLWKGGLSGQNIIFSSIISRTINIFRT
jgi:hypothetical protein